MIDTLELVQSMGETRSQVVQEFSSILLEHMYGINLVMECIIFESHLQLKIVMVMTNFLSRLPKEVVSFRSDKPSFGNTLHRTL